jgi:hypothetical protein
VKTPRLSELDNVEMREQEDSKEIDVDKLSAKMSDKKSNQEDVLSNYSASFSDLEDVDMKNDEESKITQKTRKEHLEELTKYDIKDL